MWVNGPERGINELQNYEGPKGKVEKLNLSPMSSFREEFIHLGGLWAWNIIVGQGGEVARVEITLWNH